MKDKEVTGAIDYLRQKSEERRKSYSAGIQRYIDRVLWKERLLKHEREEKELALDNLQQLVRAPELNDTDAIVNVDSLARDFLREHGRDV